MVDYCGIDVAKGKSQVCIIDENKKTLYEGELNHNLEDIHKFKQRLKEESIIGMESTGNFSKVLYYHLKEDFETYYVDNLTMHNYAKLRFLHVKNDKVDARLIAEYLMTDFKKVIPGKMDELKDLHRLYYRARKSLVKYKKSFTSQRAIIFPELEEVVYVKKGKAVPNMLLKYPTPKEIAKASTKEIYDALVEHITDERYFTLEYAKKIQEAAKTSIGVPDYPTKNFKQTIKLMMAHQEIIDSIVVDMQESLSKTPYVNLLEKRGYGVISLAGIAGEVGDIRRFTNYKKFIKYCGFDVSEKQSGQNASIHCFITKQGNKYLRNLFYNLVMPQLTNKDEEFYEFYNRLKSKGKHTRKCMVATARKIAVRTYHDMMKCHEAEVSSL